MSQQPPMQPGQQLPPGAVYVMQQPPKKKRRGLKVVLGIGAAIALIGIGSQAFNGGSGDSANSGPGAGGGEQSAAAPANPEKPANKLGTPVKVGDVEFTVSDFKCGVTVKGIFENLTPQGQFCSLKVSAKNLGKQQIMLTDNDVKLKDANDVEYSSSSESWGVADALKFAEINPGNASTGMVYIDVPKDVKPTAALVSSGFLGTSEEIPLG